MADVDISAPGRRDRKKQQTRAALIDAALRLVDERGLDRVTVEDISEAADVSPRTFFNYFATKDEALTGDQFVDSTAVIDRFHAVEPGVPVIGAILLAVTPALAEMERNRELWFIRMRVMAQNPSLVSRLLARSAAAELDLVTAIADRLGVSARSAYPQVTAAVAGAAVRTAMIRWADCAGTRTLVDLVHEAFQVVATGLADPSSEEAR
jgi:AcrR family transcriptional regulator